ncbi:MAG: cobalamin biosynthesis protein CbiG [Methanosarcina sp.]|nr:cobalamin biosynthesis protein CbiG [Methanosarcina sp.]MDD3872885.1 cobalamin biosynthesis protein CbiG [Methanosarcina sp.]MDD4523464.1 cobalamin biosynthesis protein CbiG [Methanosarcina sp.]
MLLYEKGIFKKAFKSYGVIIAVFATGIVVRDIAPLLDNKWSDPAVVVVDSNLNFAIPLLGGHHGANEIARKLSQLGAVPVLTTATEVHGKPSVEGIADRFGCEIFNKQSTVAVNCALLDQEVEVLEVKGPRVVIVDEDVSVLVRKRQENTK